MNPAFIRTKNHDFRQFEHIRLLGDCVVIPSVMRNQVLEFQIPPLPPESQRATVAETEAEQTLVTASRDLIARMEKKIQSTLARVWGELHLNNKSK